MADVKPITDLSKLCVHTITTKPWSIETAIQKYAQAGIKGITIWRQWLENKKISDIKTILQNEGMTVVSTCRGGFFPSVDKIKRQESIDENRRALDEAAEVGAPMIVLVCGADPGQSLIESRAQIVDGIASLLEHASKVNVKLAIEPLHPMYADTRSAVNTMAQANEMCERLRSPMVGVAVDVYHVWWDPDLAKQIHICAENDRLLAFHICDWRSPTEDMLNDRGLMGEGCIDIKGIRQMVEKNGFDGFHEVEVFSTRWWNNDQDEFLDQIVSSYKKYS